MMGTLASFMAAITAAAIPSTGAVEAGPEQRIDNNVCSGNSLGRRQFRRAAPTVRCRCCIALELFARANEQYVDRVAALSEDAGSDKSVATIVARPGDNKDAASRWMPRRRLGDRTAGILHQYRSRDAASDREPIGLRHLVGAEQLDHTADLTDRL